MNINKKTFIAFIFVTFTQIHSSSKHSIVLFIRPLPLELQNMSATQIKAQQVAKIKQDLETVGKVTKRILQSALDPDKTSGIYAMYQGYLSLSNINGMVMFPRNTKEADFNIVISNKVHPVFMFHVTISHWETERGFPVKKYSVTRKQDKETKLFYWEVREEEVISPKINPNNTIIIVAKPQNILVPEGITPTTDTPQIILPDIFYKKGFSSVANALNVWDIKEFFDTPIQGEKVGNLYTEITVR
ncbi:MAG: hypothetical protein UR26_C0002G0012 [candidate division TM6 bacterium GW2011_GWF2_32_72]|nr:MAG: hypothetical protein UR26_C0002G0012 [candidate division TM6 bacterium GW2011_GWF2_32_72]